uniref:Survival of motor neuron-related-splicing factor 30 n=1 Tax=Magallana gigas TaxID=29159 RepID=K1Q3I2_MAGGI
MADELQENLATYKLQLQQVEASLTTDPDNEDLNKLKKDLQEVIDLTEDLVGNKQLTAIAVDASASGSGLGSLQDIAPAEWKVGDPCLAVWSKDGQLYEAKIDEILEDGTCAITFDSYGNTDVTETFSKTNKGKVKKSIFATPDAVNGKVGVGTCGQGGRPMTSFQHAEKWKK